MLNKKHRATNRIAYGIESLERRQLLTNMLVFTAQPTTTNAGSIINAPTGVQVTVETSAGVPITSNTDSITIAIGTNPGGATLGGKLTENAVSGVATFSTLFITAASDNYKLSASDNSDVTATSAASPAFGVNAVPYFSNLESRTGSATGFEPEGGLAIDSDGNLFGTTEYGGLYGDGTVFELSGSNYSTYTTLVSFSGANGPALGANPKSRVSIRSDGTIFGTTVNGGTSSDGTVFELSGPNHTTFSSLVSFTGTGGTFPGQEPFAGVTLDASGNLYGTTAFGGSANGGIAFELVAPAYSTYTVLTSFTTSEQGYYPPGREPFSDLVIDSNGNLYGTTNEGGSSDAGTVFELSGTSHSTLTSLVQFTGGNNAGQPGAIPEGGLAIDNNGNLYGTIYFGPVVNGAGMVFELAAPTHETLTPLVEFTGSSGSFPGSNPTGDLIVDGGGNIYGTTSMGGTSAAGSVFELSGSNHTVFSQLASLTGSVPGYSESANTNAGVVLDSAGNILGVTGGGGSYGLGSIFSISSAMQNSLVTAYSFRIDDGNVPHGNLVLGSNGDLFASGSTGPSGDGSILELSGPNYSTVRTLVTFTGQGGSDPGSVPIGNLIFDGNGNLYGMTAYGGTTGETENNGYGTVFELSGPNYNTFTSLVSFTNFSGACPGSFPDSLVLGTDGNIYGTTLGGGGTGNGTIFELSGPNHSVFTSLVSTFTGTSGFYLGTNPTGLTVDAHGNIFGVTSTGGTADTYNGGDGTLFALLGTAHAFVTLFSFTGATGAYPGSNPSGPLALDTSGDLYGTTTGTDLTSYVGSAYELSVPIGGSFTTLASETEMEPGLSIDGHGNVYGATSGGGVTDGTIFELSGAAHTTLTNIVSFTGLSGPYPGESPTSDLISDGMGNLYGTTVLGGTYNEGTLYELNNSGEVSLTESSGSVTVAPPTMGSVPNEGFSTVSIGAGATIAMTPTTSLPTILTTSRIMLAGTTSAWTGTFDISNNDLDVTAGSLATLTNMIAEGYHSGTWTGLGITSSTAAADSTHLTALGVIQNNQSGTAIYSSTNLFDGTAPGASDILVKFTYYGDANLDGKVDGSDYTKIDAGFNSQATSSPLTGWINGDFNYDGKVDGSDYTLIDNAFNKQAASLAVEVAATVATDKTAIAIAAANPTWKRDHKASAAPAAASAASAVVTAAGSRGQPVGSAGGDSR